MKRIHFNAMYRYKVNSSHKQQMRDFLKDLGDVFSRFPQEANQALEDQWEIVVTEATSEVCRRDEQLHDLRTELSLQTLHAEDVSQQQNQEHAGLHQQLTGLVQETLQQRELLEASRTAQSAAGPKIDRFWRREEELLREVRCQNKWPSKNWGSIVKESDRPGVPYITDIRRPAISPRATQRNYAITSMSCATRHHTRSGNSRHGIRNDSPTAKDWKPKSRDSLSSERSRINAGRSEQFGWSKPPLDSRCLCWWQCWHIDIIGKPSPGTSNQSCIREHSMPEAAPKFAPSSGVRHQRATQKLHWQHPVHSLLRLLCWLKVQFRQSQSLIVEDRPLLTNGLHRQNLEVGKSTSRAKSIMVRSFPETLCCGWWRNYWWFHHFSDSRCVATSTSSVSRITETGISHLPEAVVWPRAVPTQREYNTGNSFKNGCISGLHHQRESRKLQWQYTNLLFRRLLYQMRVQTLHWHPWFWRTKKKETEAILIDNWLQPTEFRSGKISFKSEVSLSWQHPKPPCYGLVWLRMPKVLTSSLLPLLSQETQYQTSRILVSRLQAGSGRS